MSRARNLLVGGLVLLSLAIAGLLLTNSSLQWRGRVVAMKLGGSIPDMSWGELYSAMKPGNRYLDHEELFATGNIFGAIRNRYTNQADVDAGKAIFEANCLACHSANQSDAHGIGPDLGAGNFEHGSSDWALFRNISHGIANTAMLPVKLQDRETWQVIAYVKSELPLRSAGTSAVAVPPPSVSYERLVDSEREPHNWLTYSGSFNGQRYSQLDLIDTSNIGRLSMKWAYQTSSPQIPFEATPLVVDGIMYLTEPPNDVVALAADSGRVLWKYKRGPQPAVPVCCGRVNRGLAVLDNTLFLGTIDAHLVALDARNGSVIWETEVADYEEAYSITGAPLALKGMVITGVGGGDYATRCFVAAYDARNGEELWRFHTIPEAGAPGNETWAGDSWRTGGGATWVTGSFDPELNLVYWGTGNPAPDYNGDAREGDNLYTASVVALDADTGELRWFYQFTPHDEHDRDANQIPILVDADYEGRVRKLMLWANRNGFYYVLDRETGEYLTAQAYVDQDWADGIDPDGRPIVRASSAPTFEGTSVRPGNAGATNWWSPSYSPVSGLVYVPTIETRDLFFRGNAEIVDGQMYNAGAAHAGTFESAAIRALHYSTGDIQWEFRAPEPRPSSVRQGGLLSTAGNLVFGGMGDRFYVLDATTGKELRRFYLGGNIYAAPVTYESSGTQQLTVAAGRSVFTFALGN